MEGEYEPCIYAQGDQPILDSNPTKLRPSLHLSLCLSRRVLTCTEGKCGSGWIMITHWNACVSGLKSKDWLPGQTGG